MFFRSLVLYLATSPFGSDALQPGKEERKRTSMTASVAERRIKKELQKLKKAGDEVGMTVEVGASNTEWFVTIVGEAPWTCEWHIGSKQSQACAVLSPDWLFFGVRYGFGVPSCVCFLKPCISTSIEPAPVCRFATRCVALRPCLSEAYNFAVGRETLHYLWYHAGVPVARRVSGSQPSMPNNLSKKVPLYV